MLLTVAGLVLFSLGLAIGWYGLRPLTVLPRLLWTETVAPSEVSSADSFVVCRGRASDDGKTVTSPFRGTRCLGFEFEVTERQPFAIGIPWFQAHVDDGVAPIPFSLEDQAGSIGVDPSPRRFSLDTESTVVTVGGSETPPSRIQRFLDSRDGVSAPASWLTLIPGLGYRRYAERRIDPDEQYVVAGRPEQQGGTTLLTGNLVIADHSSNRIVLNRLLASVFPVLIAIVFVASGASILTL
jgi:hypothetical protein